MPGEKDNDRWNRYIISKNDQGRRLDRIIRKYLPSVPLSQIYKAFRKKKIRIKDNPKPLPNTRPELGDELYIHTSLDSGMNNRDSGFQKQQDSALSEKCKNHILHECKHLFFLNKPRGMVVHGKDSLNDMVLAYFVDKNIPSLSFKPGPLHRLDRNTSGVITFSKTLHGAQVFSRLLKERKISKHYLAVIEGELEGNMVFTANLSRNSETKTTVIADTDSGKTALTNVVPLFQNKSYCFCAVSLHTGRTHQIRAHLAQHGTPLAGDAKYGSKKKTSYFLHAYCINIPSTDLLNCSGQAYYAPFSIERLASFFSSSDIKTIQKEIHNFLE
ncbi:MAG: RluA family pseudouridine synthase [Spirochaetia bacterium]